MPHIKAVEEQTIIGFNNQELRLIGLALSGKLRSNEDKQAAEELNRWLLDQQKRAAEERLKVLNGAIEKAREP